MDPIVESALLIVFEETLKRLEKENKERQIPFNDTFYLREAIHILRDKGA